MNETPSDGARDDDPRSGDARGQGAAGAEQAPAVRDIAPMRRDDVAAIVRELAPALVGGRVREVRQRGEHDLVVTIRRPGQNVWLVVSAHPRASRLYALGEKPSSPARPSAFQDACRHDLRGGGVVGLACEPGDRRVTLSIVRGGEVSRLEAELYGRFANLVLVGPDGAIRSVLRPVDGQRTLVPNARYEPAAPPGDAPPEEPDAIPSDAPRADDGPIALPLSDAAAAHYEAGVEAADVDAARTALLRRLRQARKKLDGKIASLERQQAASNDAESVRQAGDLLKANLHAVRRGQTRVEVLDYYADPPTPRVIELDPVKTPAANLAAIFKRYRKLESGRAQTATVLAAVRENAERLDAIVARVDVARTPADVDVIEAEAIRHRILRAKQRPRPAGGKRDADAGPGYLTFESVDGLPIVVGRTSRENETVTFKVARGGDRWLHVRDYPGSHVVVRLPRGTECPHETLLDAAHLAVHFSKIRGATRAEVTHTARKYVQKPRGAGAGQVTLSRPSVLSLRVEPDRLGRLLGRLAP